MDGSAAETIAVFLAVRRADGTDPVFATGTRVARALTANMPRVGGALEAVGTSAGRLSRQREAARVRRVWDTAVSEWHNLISHVIRERLPRNARVGGRACQVICLDLRDVASLVRPRGA